jgi:hypothetical protein
VVLLVLLVALLCLFLLPSLSQITAQLAVAAVVVAEALLDILTMVKKGLCLVAWEVAAGEAEDQALQQTQVAVVAV